MRDLHDVVVRKVEGLKDIVKVVCGSDYTMALDKRGKIYSFGNNGYGQLGISGNATKVMEPKMLFIPASAGRVVDIACGEEHSAYLDDQGRVHTWGYGNDGQLGHGTKTSLNTPKRVDCDSPVSKVVCGGGHTGLLTKNGDLYLMGRGRDGQLGRGNHVESVAASLPQPTLVDYFSDNKLRVDDFSLGTNHSIAVVSPRL